jgi:hypothetical protein
MGLWRKVNLGNGDVWMLTHSHFRSVPAADNRLANDLLRRSLGHQLSLMEKQNAVCPQRGEIEVVQHDADVQLAAAGQPF